MNVRWPQFAIYHEEDITEDLVRDGYWFVKMDVRLRRFVYRPLTRQAQLFALFYYGVLLMVGLSSIFIPPVTAFIKAHLVEAIIASGSFVVILGIFAEKKTFDWGKGLQHMHEEISERTNKPY